MPTTWYVSKQTGNDANSGSGSITAAKATIQAGINLLVASAGDSLYIGPGTYYEILTLAKGGIVSNKTKIIGDPDCLILTADNPGTIRVTTSTLDGFTSLSGGSYRIFDVSSYGHYEVYNMLFDGQGSSNNRVLTGTDVTTYGIYGAMHTGAHLYNYFYNCCVQNISVYAARQVILENCLLQGALAGTYDCWVNNSVCFSGTSPIRGDSVANGITNRRSIASNSICFGANNGILNSWTYNCLIIGGYYGYQTSVINNSTGLGSYVGIYNINGAITTPATAINNVFLSNCSYGYNASNSVSGSTTAYFSSIYSLLSTAGERSTAMTATTTAAPIYRFDGWKAKEYIKKAFEPIPEQCGLSGRGNFSLASSAGSYDILGKTRIMGTGDQIDIGPYALSNIEEKYVKPYYQISPPGLYFTNNGEKIFDIYASIGNITVSAYMIDQAGDGMTMILRGDKIATSTFDTDLSGTLQIGSVSASITGSDQKLTLVIRNNAPSSTGCVSDIRVY